MDTKNSEKSMTALVCAFARAYHREVNEVRIFDDSMARELLYDEEYYAISKNMSDGIDFFNKCFKGDKDEALRWIVDNQLSPSPLGRGAYAERSLEMAIRKGIEQYIIFAAGFDTFGYRQPRWAERLQIFEIDHPLTLEEKVKRLVEKNINVPNNVYHIAADLNEAEWVEKLTAHEAFKGSKKSFCSLLGITYYISEQSFKGLLNALNKIIPTGSIIVMDYPAREDTFGDKRVKKQEMLAQAAKEAMVAKYSDEEINGLFSGCGYQVQELLTPDDITDQFFCHYNMANKDHPIKALLSVNFLTAVKE
ncbi:MAG: class I SAM-dependent methyltransferase [Clostridiales bacterium]|nr:class I SAM-dependent methyltransferase [Clostridiales bacterium]